jgi:hypothetical protein
MSPKEPIWRCRLIYNSLDVEYLLRWVRELELTAELAEIWVEAFPEEEPPVS